MFKSVFGAGALIVAMAGYAIADEPVPVTIDNFVRAATDIEFRKYLENSGGVNKLFHVAQPTPLDMQPTIRMNRDTLYSMAVIDLSEGAVLTVPDPGDRYVSAQVVNQDHYVNKVFHGGGTFEMTMEEFDTRYVAVLMRFLVDSEDPEDLAKVHALQQGMTLTAGGDGTFDAPTYNKEQFETLLQATLDVARFSTSSARTFGPSDRVAPLRHFLGTAFGWGGLPEEEAYYLNVEPDLPVGAYRVVVPAGVPVDAFWSVSLYNAGGFFEKNDLGAYSVNSVTGQPNDDGSMTVHFGACDDGRVNCLPIMEGWNFVVRYYQPDASIIDGSWVFPEIEDLN